MSDQNNKIDENSRLEKLELKIAKLEKQIDLLALETKKYNSLKSTILAYRLSIGIPFLKILLKILNRIFCNFVPKLGNFEHYNPIKLNNYNHDYKNITENKLTIGIVTPSYNCGRYIEKTILSVLSQNNKNIKYIIQDNMSVDETKLILEKYKNLISYDIVPDSGQANAINNGFNKIDTDIMGWINADDILLPNAVNIIVDFFFQNPEIDIVYANRIIINHDDLEIGRWILPSHDEKILNSQFQFVKELNKKNI